MKNLMLVVLAVVLSAAMVVSGLFYFVGTPSGIHLVQKVAFHYRVVYIDTGNWGVTDYALFPEIRQAVIDGRLPSHNNMRAKLLAAEKFLETAEKMDAALEVAGEEAREIGKAAQEKSKVIAEKTADVSRRALDKGRDLADKSSKAIKGFLNR